MDKTNPYIQSEGDAVTITESGYALLKELVTDPTGPVYVFTDKASPILAAASMARLSRRGSDLREIYLDEFAGNESKADALIRRVVTAFGDDSVQQLLGLHVVVESASNLLTKKLEWGRFGSYLEQSTRYIFFDKKNHNGKYRYYTPTNLEGELKETYMRAMDDIFQTYSDMVHKLTKYVRSKTTEPAEAKKAEHIAWLGATRAQACDAIRPVLPVATTATVGIFASTQALESLVVHLLSENLEEYCTVGRQILREVRKVAPVFFERADLPERGGATALYRMETREKIAKLTFQALGGLPHRNENAVTLIEYWPKRELDLVPEMLFAESTLPLAELHKKVNRLWDNEWQSDIFKTYMGQRLNRRHKPGRAIEKIHYEWEIVGGYDTFRDLQRHRVVDMLEWQRLNTSYGYDVPQLVVDAGLEENFHACFRLSQKMYGKLITAGFSEEAQYATLLGHKMRYRFMVNAREAFHLHEIRTTPQGHPGYRKIVNEMHRQLCAVHPLLGEAMCFVNKDEDPELTRLAGELTIQKKLAQLGPLE